MNSYVTLVLPSKKGVLRTTLACDAAQSSGYITATSGDSTSTSAKKKMRTHALLDGESVVDAAVRIIKDYQDEGFSVDSMSDDFKSLYVVMDIENPEACKDDLKAILCAFVPTIEQQFESGSSFEASIFKLKLKVAVIAGELESVSCSFWSNGLSENQAAVLHALQRLSPSFIDTSSTPVSMTSDLRLRARTSTIGEEIEQRLSRIGIAVRPERIRVKADSPLAMLAGI